MGKTPRLEIQTKWDQLHNQVNNKLLTIRNENAVITHVNQ